MGKSIKDATDAASKSTTNGRKRYVLKDEGIRWEKCIIPFQWGDGFGMFIYVHVWVREFCSFKY